MRYCISIDWFQYYCKSTPETLIIPRTYFSGKDKNVKGYISQYYVDECCEFHSMFRSGATIYLHKMPLVHIHWHPKPSSLPSNAVAVKVANRLLYSSSWSFYLHDIIAALHLNIVSITRCDLCCDFQSFAGGLLPCDFIQRYVNDGDAESHPQYVRVGGNTFCIHGRKRIDYEEPDTKVGILGTSNQLDYIRWGSRNSGVCTYLYNKSQELKDKHSKPYIQRMWDEQGIIEDDNLPVYRLELSISSKGMKLRPKGAKKKDVMLRPTIIRALSRDDFGSQSQIETTFWTYANRYFRFRKVGKQKYRKDMEVLQLWDCEVEPHLKPSYFNTEHDTGVAERRAARTLQKIVQEYPDLNSKEVSSMRTTGEVLCLIGAMKERLEMWNDDGLGLLKGLDLESFKKLKFAGIVSSIQYDAIAHAVDVAVSNRVQELMAYADECELLSQLSVIDGMRDELARWQDEAINQIYNNYQEI